MTPRAALAILAAAAVGGGALAGSPGRDGATRRAGGAGRAGGVGGFGSRPPGTVRVVRVVDGDTIDVAAADGRRDVVRYIGIDTPESVKPNTPVQCYAKAASHENERLVEGRTVRLRLDAEPRDRYGRLLAYVYLGPELINAQLLTGGFARTLTIPPNDHFAKRFSLLQLRARAAGRGLWGQC